MRERMCFPYKDDMKDLREYTDDVEMIHNKMMDDLSEMIFSNRLLFSLTGNHKYMKYISLQTVGGKNLYHTFLDDDHSKYIYGAGIRGRRLIELFPEHKWDGFIDQNSTERSYNNIKIVNLEQFAKLYQYRTKILLSNMANVEEIISDLLKAGVFREDIYILSDFDAENMKDIYFLPECMKYMSNADGAFVDIGCYDGKDSIGYLRWMNNREADIYAFEPDVKNYEVCQKNLEMYPNIKLFRTALSDTEEELNTGGEGEMVHLGTNGKSVIRTQQLDGMVGDQKIGFIKMDVEGYEEKVLNGAKKIISSQHPLLAVSVYHKRADIWRLPRLILNLNSNYCFYMRHYGATTGDTVLYAIDKSKVCD